MSEVYQPIKLLGQGGFGVVELVLETSTGHHFARKTFKPSALGAALTANVRKRFAREARTQSGIDHRNIVHVWPVGLGDDPPWYLMPVADGNLDQDLACDRFLGGKFLSAIADIASALDELHQSGIYHRDLKPQNILRFNQSDAPGFRYAISDFGLVAMNESRVSALTTTGMAKGTDYYTAPEITSDLKKATPQSDIYSLGCILHDMVGKGNRVPCHEIREDGEYGPILRSCTRSDPARRFSSVRALYDALLSVSTGTTAPTTEAAVGFSQQLESGDPLSVQSWRGLIDYVEDNSGTQDAHAVLGRLRLDQIQQLCVTDAALADRLCLVYSEWARRGAFAFERCDGLANNLETFVSFVSLEARMEALVALLYLGTSHNRWYVERKFMKLCGPALGDEMARRMAIEFRATGKDICLKISHLENSIQVSRQHLHPVLAQVLGEICS